MSIYGLTDSAVHTGHNVYFLIKDWSTPMLSVVQSLNILTVPPMIQSLNILLLVAVVCGLAYFTTKVIGGAKMNRGSRRNLEIVESIGVGTQSYVHIIRVGEKFVLIGTTRGQVNMLSQLDPAMLKLSNTGQGAGFDSFLNVFMKKENDPDNIKNNDSEKGND